MAAMLLACVIGGYTLIGGLGATFYVSYFNTALIFVLILMLVVEVSSIEKMVLMLPHISLRNYSKCIKLSLTVSFNIIFIY